MSRRRTAKQQTASCLAGVPWQALPFHAHDSQPRLHASHPRSPAQSAVTLLDILDCMSFVRTHLRGEHCCIPAPEVLQAALHFPRC